MDPQAAWDRLLSAHTDGDWDEIEELASALLGWLDRGGFPPKVIDCPQLGAELAAEWNRALARAGCLFALDLVSGRWRVAASEEEASR